MRDLYTEIEHFEHAIASANDALQYQFNDLSEELDRVVLLMSDQPDLADRLYSARETFTSLCNQAYRLVAQAARTVSVS